MRQFRQYTFLERRARTYRNELARLAKHRAATGVETLLDAAWLTVVADITVAIWGSSGTMKKLDGVLIRLGFAGADLSQANSFLATAARARRAEDYDLLSGGEVARLIGLSWREREAAQIKTIAAIDETSKARRRRLDKRRKAEKRAHEGARSRAHSHTAKAKSLGISRSQYYKLGLDRVEPVAQILPDLCSKGQAEESVHAGATLPKKAEESVQHYVPPEPNLEKADETVHSEVELPDQADALVRIRRAR